MTASPPVREIIRIRQIMKPWATVVSLALIALTSCTTVPESYPIPAAHEIPGELPMSKGAGRGNLLVVTLRLESGEELPFIIDTGASVTVFDKSFKSKLGKPVGTGTLKHWGVVENTAYYKEPKLFWGKTQLVTGDQVVTMDLKGLSRQVGQPVTGVLGADCLRHYCLQLDFVAGKVRFLPTALDHETDLGQSFALIEHGDLRFDVRGNLVGNKDTISTVDTGCNDDGWLMPKWYRPWSKPVTGSAKNGAVHSPNGKFGDEIYPEMQLHSADFESNGIGLSFLARHLVTFDFPRWKMYLKRTSIGPLVDEDWDSAFRFMKALKQEGRVPGWSKDEHGEWHSFPEIGTNSVTFVFQKSGKPSVYHYRVTRSTNDAPWQLQKAWRTDQNDQLLEEYPLP